MTSSITPPQPQEPEVTTTDTTPVPPPPARAEAAQDETPEAEAPQLDTTFRGSRVFAAIGGWMRYDSLRAGFDNAMPDALKAACRADQQARQAALTPPLPPLPSRQDKAMGRFESAHTDEGTRVAPAEPPDTGSPAQFASRIHGVLGRLRKPAAPRPGYVLPAPVQTPPYLPEFGPRHRRRL